MTNELEALASPHGSDKASPGYCGSLHEDLFEPLRDRAVRVLELGSAASSIPTIPLSAGRSLRMWRDYFPRGSMVGLDVYDKSGVAGERLHRGPGSQDDAALLAWLVSRARSIRHRHRRC